MKVDRRQFLWLLGQVGLAAFTAACGGGTFIAKLDGGGKPYDGGAEDLSTYGPQDFSVYGAQDFSVYSPQDLYMTTCQQYDMYCANDARGLRRHPSSYAAGRSLPRSASLSLFERLTDHRRS